MGGYRCLNHHRVLYYVVAEKCTECYDLAREPQCAAVCPMDAFEIFHKESDEELKEKMTWLHQSEYPYSSCPTNYYSPNHTCCSSTKS